AAALGARDHSFLQREYASIMSGLETRSLEHYALHGDPHRGNFLADRDGWLMIDFESVCSGPVEWDASALPGGGAGVFEVDKELLTELRRLRSLCVVVWCAGRAARSSEMDKASRLHLDVLRAPHKSQRPDYRSPGSSPFTTSIRLRNPSFERMLLT
ncbi:MAG TPA: phosphotransferase, partial [Candidatus Dormibacteraeota bacterium]|nr:phosphotransferase [Candidatus Dormibacteraeota bacterium]